MNNLKYVFVTMLAVIFSWILHEFAHWLTGELLGNQMAMTLNTGYPLTGHYIAHWQENVISAAGPLITLIQAIVIYYLLRVKPNKLLFPFLLTCLYMRILAGVMNFINPNDEGRISIDLGLGLFTLSILVVGILFFLTYDICKRNEFKARLVALTTLLIMLFSSVLILTDQAIKVRLL